MLSKDSTAREWNDFLIEKYGYGIWEFAHALTETLYYKGYKYFFHPGTKIPIILSFDVAYYKLLKWESIERLGNLKSHIVKVLVEERNKYGRFCNEKKISKADARKIIEFFDLEPFVKKLTNYLWDIQESLRIWNPLQNKKGRPIKPIYLIAFLWSEVMKDKKRRQWSKILDLLKWFSKRLKTSKYGQAYLNIPDNISQKNLKREFMFVFKRSYSNRGRYEFLEEQRSIYFPIKKKHKRFQIEFKDQSINIDHGKDHPLLIFPDGSQFPEKRRKRA